MLKNTPPNNELEKVTAQFILDVKRLMGDEGTYYAYNSNMSMTFATDFNTETIIVKNTCNG